MEPGSKNGTLLLLHKSKKLKQIMTYLQRIQFQKEEYESFLKTFQQQ